jgi:type I restriction enzyme S subunit
MAAWQQTRLGNISQIYSGFAFRSQDLGEKGIPVVKIANIQNKRVSPECADHLPVELCTEKLNRYFLQPDDTLIAMTGAGSVGKVGKMPRAEGRFLVNQRVGIVRPDSSLCDPAFVYFALSQDFYETKLYGLGLGAGQPNVSAKQIGELEIPFPPLAVQQRIAGILSAYDELMENSQRRIRLLEAMARALYREWFVHFRFPGHEKLPRVASPLGDIPQGWEISPLSSLVDFAKGRKPAETRPESLPGDVKLLLIDSLHGGEAVFASPAKLVLAETRDTIMVMDGASSCEVTIGSSGAVGSTLGRFRTTRPGVFSPHALYRFLEAKADEFKSKNIGAAIPHANKDYILTQPVALPPKATASGFHAQLEPIQCTIETLKLQIQNLRRTRDLLLPRLLSGQVNLKTH